jgi:predicted phage-related endonuclease
MKLGLTAQEIAARRAGIGGSDAAKIVAGEWHALWLDKTGRSQPEDLSRVLPVQLGSFTEEFNAYWFQLMGYGEVSSRGSARIHETHKFLRCTLDGIVDALSGRPRVWQAKHVAGRQPLAEVVARYTPQVCHEMIVCGLTRGVLSVLIGTDRFEVADIELDEFWGADYIERCAAFWQHVETDTEPKEGAPLAVPPPVEHFRTVDMRASNAWGEHAAVWIANQKPAKLFEGAAKELKALVEPDVGEAFGHGIAIKRNKAGSLSIKEKR